ncbi:hypothetical protein C8R45DRAFT_933162 [Mycena sanguinolenta]|nr:hypothetical protein C8R45DRAFT_933162 [Mycena sanguinolenta]
MPPSRSSAVRRPGPACLLPYIHLPAHTCKDRLWEKRRHEAEEHQRRAANERVHAAPDNAILQMKYQQALEDYEDNYTLFIEDEALAEWFGKKQEAEGILRRLERVALDTHPYNDPAPLCDFNSKYTAFVHEYSTSFTLADEDRLVQLRNELEVHDQLMVAFAGDTDRLREEFGRKYCSITIRNPFASLDVCRPEFDKHLCALYATFTGKNEADIPPTLGLPKFLISLANPFYDRPDGEACIALYYQRHRRNLPKCSEEINRGGDRARARDFGSAPRCAAELLQASLDNERRWMDILLVALLAALAMVDFSVEGAQERANAQRVRPEIVFRQARAYILTDQRVHLVSLITKKWDRSQPLETVSAYPKWARKENSPLHPLPKDSQPKFDDSAQTLDPSRRRPRIKFTVGDAATRALVKWNRGAEGAEVQLAVGGVGGKAAFYFEGIDKYSKTRVEGADDAADRVKLAFEILVLWVRDMRQCLFDWVPNTSTKCGVTDEEGIWVTCCLMPFAVEGVFVRRKIACVGVGASRAGRCAGFYLGKTSRRVRKKQWDIPLHNAAWDIPLHNAAWEVPFRNIVG